MHAPIELMVRIVLSTYSTNTVSSSDYEIETQHPPEELTGMNEGCFCRSSHFVLALLSTVQYYSAGSIGGTNTSSQLLFVGINKLSQMPHTGSKIFNGEILPSKSSKLSNCKLLIVVIDQAIIQKLFHRQRSDFSLLCRIFIIFMKIKIIPI